jgi:hypothetical protein
MKILGGFLICAVLVCGMGAGPCWVKSQPVYASTPIVSVVPTVVYQPITLYQPMVVRETRLVPIVENKVVYRPINSYYLNHGNYYQYVPYAYYNQYDPDPWVRYNY